MKKMLILTLIGATILSCSNDDDNQGDISHQIIGDWKLVEAKFYGIAIIGGEGYLGEDSIDYRNENIVYRFQANGTLIVSGEENAGYSNGEYPYFFGYDYLGPSGLPPILLVKTTHLNFDVKWTYDLTNGIMTLGKSYVDGPDLVFERVKGRE